MDIIIFVFTGISLLLIGQVVSSIECSEECSEQKVADAAIEIAKLKAQIEIYKMELDKK